MTKFEKQIRNILKKYGVSIREWRPEIAAEISAIAYPGEFLWWLVTDAMKLFEPPVMFDTKPNYSELVWYSYENDKDYTLPDLYRWWQDNVEGK